MKVHYSSKTPEWSTPQEITDDLGPFDLDPCASPSNAKAPLFFTVEDDGLSKEWTGRVWMNPPYGRQIKKWVEKAALSEALVVALLPSRTDTRWWHDWVMPYADEILFVRGRIKFSAVAVNAPFPCVIVVFGAGTMPPRFGSYVLPSKRGGPRSVTLEVGKTSDKAKRFEDRVSRIDKGQRYRVELSRDFDGLWQHYGWLDNDDDGDTEVCAFMGFPADSVRLVSRNVRYDGQVESERYKAEVVDTTTP